MVANDKTEDQTGSTIPHDVKTVLQEAKVIARWRKKPFYIT
jgi:hypothetical protein